MATLKGGDDPMDWDFDFSATSGKFVAVFASDLNNPVPKKGFDLVYAGKYGSATAGENGGFCLCDFGGNCAWPCDEEAPACGGTCHVPTSEDEGARPRTTSSASSSPCSASSASSSPATGARSRASSRARARS